MIRHPREPRARRIPGGMPGHEIRENTNDRSSVAPKANYMHGTIWIDPMDGSKYHSRPTCPGLAKAAFIRAYMRCPYCAQEWADGFAPRLHNDDMRYIGPRPHLTEEEIVNMNDRFSVSGCIRMNRENIQEGCRLQDEEVDSEINRRSRVRRSNEQFYRRDRPRRRDRSRDRDQILPEYSSSSSSNHWDQGDLNTFQ